MSQQFESGQESYFEKMSLAPSFTTAADNIVTGGQDCSSPPGLYVKEEVHDFDPLVIYIMKESEEQLGDSNKNNTELASESLSNDFLTNLNVDSRVGELVTLIDCNDRNLPSMNEVVHFPNNENDQPSHISDKWSKSVTSQQFNNVRKENHGNKWIVCVDVSSGDPKCVTPVKPSNSNSKIQPKPEVLVELLSGIKLYECKICGSSFSHKRNLCRHVKKHTDGRRYQCDLCLKTFFRSDYLKQHLQIHEKERRFKCQVCSKSYVRRFYLERHARTHSGDRPYACLLCGKAFYEKEPLRVHSRIHSGVKPYKCDECGKTFTQSSHLRAHRKMHRPVRPTSKNNIVE